MVVSSTVTRNYGRKQYTIEDSVGLCSGTKGAKDVKQPQKQTMRVQRWCPLHKTARHNHSERRNQQKKTEREKTGHSGTVATPAEETFTSTHDERESECLLPVQAYAIQRHSPHPPSKKETILKVAIYCPLGSTREATITLSIQT